MSDEWSRLMEDLPKAKEALAVLSERLAFLEKSDAANAELAAEALKQRDEYKLQLQELLAVIHEDGGQHTESRGLAASCLDARETFYRLRRERNEAIAERRGWWNR